jgi:hypothetical protein
LPPTLLKISFSVGGTWADLAFLILICLPFLLALGTLTLLFLELIFPGVAAATKVVGVLLLGTLLFYALLIALGLFHHFSIALLSAPGLPEQDKRLD